jgi:DNA (cytosine-5)-methyltransferase 1
MNYYNENDPRAAAWLRELIAARLIPAGVVDTRSIAEVRGDELREYTQCHFFAGIGGWSEALRLAGWPEDCPVWTGSCPCQPFSVAGKGAGERDPRHLWPEFRRLIAECAPPIVFGEQVASLAGRGWLAGVRVDLEGLGYGVGAADLCAAGSGAPHLRHRLWWVAYANGGHTRAEGIQRGGQHRQQPGNGGDLPVADPKGGRFGINGSASRHTGHVDECRAAGPMVHTDQHGLEALARHGDDRDQSRRHDAQPLGHATETSHPGFWHVYDILPCLDGKARRIEPGTFPLAHGVPARVGRLRGYGNAIVPQVAAVFIRAADATLSDLRSNPV